MDSNSNYILPYIFGIVVHKPDRSGLYKDIIREVETALYIHNEPAPANLKEAVDAAIQQGKEFGLIYTNGEKLRVPFKIKTTVSTVSMLSENSYRQQDTAEYKPKPKHQPRPITRYAKHAAKAVKKPVLKAKGREVNKGRKNK